MDELRTKARQLLTDGAVKIVIGYGEGTNGRVHPVFIQKPEACDKLIYDTRCLHNLAVYLRKPEVVKMEKMAIVATLPVMRTIIHLASEHQLVEANITVLGIGENGKLLDLPNFKAMEDYVKTVPYKLSPSDQAQLETIGKMALQERWQYWQDQLSRCFKCYACRASCPFCYCARCAADCNQPQWISTSSHPLGNLEWHMVRAMHLAGRCVECGACGRACPLDIPIHLLTYKMAEDAYRQFQVRAGESLQATSALSTYKTEDKENFIR